MTIAQRHRTVASLGLAILWGLAAGCATPPPPAATGPAGRVYVANESSGTVSIIDAEAQKVVTTVDLKALGTHDLALTRDGKTLFATSLATGTLFAIDTATGQVVGSLYTGNRCHSVALTNDEKQLWVVNIGENNISVIDVATLRILGTIPVGRVPGHLRFTKDGRFAYITLQGEDSVEVIDTGNHRVIAKIPAGKTPHFLIPSPDGKYMWGGGTGGDDVYVIDVATNQRVGALAVGTKPQHIAFGFRGMVGPLAYVVVESKNEIVVVNADPKDLKIVDRIPVGSLPNGIGADRTGTRLFVANQGAGSVSVIDTGTHRVIGTIPVGLKPVGVVVSF